MITAIAISFFTGVVISHWWNKSMYEKAAHEAMKDFAQDLAWKSTYKERMEALDKIDQIDKFYDRKEQQ